jgi:hypothetical protein
MSDPAVSKMKPYGRASVWTYGENRNFPGWHLCCNRQASAFLISLIDVMLAAKWPANKKVPLVVDAILTAATGCTAAPRFARSLEIRFAKANEAGLWRLEEREGDISLSLGEDSIKALRKGIVDLTSGNGDYSIGDDPSLWFWWEVKE